MPARPKRPDSDVGQPKTARLGCRQQTSATSGRAVTGGPRRGPVALPVSESARRMPPVGRPGRPGLHSGPGRRLGGFKLPAAAESERLAPSRPGDEWPATPPAGGPPAGPFSEHIRVTQRISSWAPALGEPRPSVPAAAGTVSRVSLRLGVSYSHWQSESWLPVETDEPPDPSQSESIRVSPSHSQSVRIAQNFAVVRIVGPARAAAATASLGGLTAGQTF